MGHLPFVRQTDQAEVRRADPDEQRHRRRVQHRHEKHHEALAVPKRRLPRMQRNPLSTRRNRTRCATQRHLSERRNGGPSNAMLSCFCVREFLHARCLKPTETQAGALKHRSARQERQHESERTARTRKLTRTGCAAPTTSTCAGTSFDERRGADGLSRKKDANIEIEFPITK